VFDEEGESTASSGWRNSRQSEPQLHISNSAVSVLPHYEKFQEGIAGDRKPFPPTMSQRPRMSRWGSERAPVLSVTLRSAIANSAPIRTSRAVLGCLSPTVSTKPGSANDDDHEGGVDDVFR
jgi:hypothetical protein